MEIRYFGKDPEKVIEYLGRYINRTAITNNRLISYEDRKVTFTYKDYRDGGKRKEMTLDENEFIRRFCLHILPRRFIKLDRLRSSVKLSCNQLFLDVFKVVDHTLPGLVSTAD